MASDFINASSCLEKWPFAPRSDSPTEPAEYDGISHLMPSPYEDDTHELVHTLRLDESGSAQANSEAPTALLLATPLSAPSGEALATLNMQATAIPPPQTRLDTLLVSDLDLSLDGDIESTLPSAFNPRDDLLVDTAAIKSLSSKRRRNTLSNHIPDMTSNGPRHTSRRRKSESTHADATRAIHLEKNRKAASRCRSKQKKQQEELVETVRKVEWRNKTLKAELGFLKSHVRDLVDLAGVHADCPDNRLSLYIQYKADLLVADK